MTDIRSTPFFAIAVTGGIAAGKSAVTGRFQALGVPVHDADLAARAVVAPGSEGLREIIAHFGNTVVSADGTLDRAAMRAQVFADTKTRAALEAIVHPRIHDWLRQQAQAQHQPYALLALPLLAEHRGAYAWLDRIVLVEAPESLRIRRLIARDGISPTLAEQMLASQASDAARRAIADEVLDNSGAETRLDAAVQGLHQRYLRLAAEKAKHLTGDD